MDPEPSDSAETRKLLQRMRRRRIGASEVVQEANVEAVRRHDSKRYIRFPCKTDRWSRESGLALASYDGSQT